MLFTDLLKSDLVKAVEFYKIEVDVNANKQALANALLDAGITPEQWEKESREWDYGSDEPALEEPTPAEEEEDEAEEEEESETKGNSDTEVVLVRFIGRNRSYVTQGNKFSANRPFALIPRHAFESMDSKKFREATPAEAQEFYN